MLKLWHHLAKMDDRQLTKKIFKWSLALANKSKSLMFIFGCISGPTVGSKKSWKRKSQREAGDDDFEDKENTG